MMKTLHKLFPSYMFDMEAWCRPQNKLSNTSKCLEIYLPKINRMSALGCCLEAPDKSHPLWVSTLHTLLTTSHLSHTSQNLGTKQHPTDTQPTKKKKRKRKKQQQ